MRQKIACTHFQLESPIYLSLLPIRAYRGVWFGTEVCVKVLDLYAPLSTAGGSGSTFSAAPLLEAALSKALLHPNIVSGLAACCAQHHACAHGCNPGMNRFQQSGSHRQRRIILQAPLFTTACLAVQVPTHAWGISEGVINAQGQHHSQVWIVQVGRGARRKHNGCSGVAYGADAQAASSRTLRLS